MPDYTIEEAAEQAVKVARYFARVLREHDKGFAAWADGDAVFIAARGDKAEALVKALEQDALLGEGTVVVKMPGG